MTWKEAQQGTIRQWEGIRDAIGRADTVELLTGINAVCDLCEKSDQEAGTPIGRCDYCLFYRQFGGCREISARLSELVVSGELDEVRAIVDDIIGKTDALVLGAA
ncbi:MAG TPA: hypothetical protein VH394_24230 [Thermoanaerobaculia bacterium]|jgi:hypothetical protein|nr:hypothetical protein [Thermoanaerobaculia bacterium]